MHLLINIMNAFLGLLQTSLCKTFLFHYLAFSEDHALRPCSYTNQDLHFGLPPNWMTFIRLITALSPSSFSGDFPNECNLSTSFRCFGLNLESLRTIRDHRSEEMESLYMATLACLEIQPIAERLS